MDARAQDVVTDEWLLPHPQSLHTLLVLGSS